MKEYILKEVVLNNDMLKNSELFARNDFDKQLLKSVVEKRRKSDDNGMKKAKKEYDIFRVR